MDNLDDQLVKARNLDLQLALVENRLDRILIKQKEMLDTRSPTRRAPDISAIELLVEIKDSIEFDNDYQRDNMRKRIDAVLKAAGHK